jgi:hypothetical protein
LKAASERDADVRSRYDPGSPTPRRPFVRIALARIAAVLHAREATAGDGELAIGETGP